MKVLALDLGTKCGWCCGPTASERGLWNMSVPATYKRLGHGWRINLFTSLVIDSLLTQKVEAIAYEVVYRHKGTDAAHLYGAFQATVQMIAFRYRLPLMPIPVQWVKIAATRDCMAKKSAVMHGASVDAGEVFTDDNIADAYWIWKIATGAPVGKHRMVEVISPVETQVKHHD